jgi:hypothetical protein
VQFAREPSFFERFLDQADVSRVVLNQENLTAVGAESVE